MAVFGLVSFISSQMNSQIDISTLYTRFMLVYKNVEPISSNIFIIEMLRFFSKYIKILLKMPFIKRVFNFFNRNNIQDFEFKICKRKVKEVYFCK